ncbi:MAG: nuclear transport factor 2 family protein [Terracidiphilus sp.]
MTRVVACFSAVLLCCCAAGGQSPAPVPVSASAQPGVTSTESPEIREFQKIEDSWSNAVNQRDQYGLELVLSPLFVDISATGDITTRNQQVATVLTGEDKTIHLDQRVITVRMLGDIAVANGTYVLHHKVNTAQVDEKGVFTHVFEHARGGWLCINSQRTVLREDSNAKPKKQSNAELPFHIPLFTKSNP